MCDRCDSAVLDALALDATEDVLGTLVHVEKADDDLVPFELDLFTILRQGFREAVATFLASATTGTLLARMADPQSHEVSPGLKLQVARAVLDALHDAARVELGTQFAAAVGDEVGAVLDAMYQASRAATARLAALPTDTFTVVDENSLATLRRHNLYWIRGNYDRNVREGIERATADAIAQGLGREALARDLKRRLAARFALADRDWITIASASLNRTRNVAQVRTYELAAVTHYEVIAVLDERTSDVCRYMNGRVFSVESALRAVDALEAAESPEDVKDVMPWLRWDESRRAPFAMVRDRRVDLPTVSPASGPANRLIERVAPLPPYHGRCRSVTAMSTEIVRR